MDDLEAPGTRPTIAGHPLVRLLRRDAEREAWVAADASGAGIELHRSLAGGDATLAREAEALLAADHPHVVPILDVATDDGVVLLRPLLPVALADWLLERGAPQPGEAVTALVPIASALGALHAVGAALGGLAAHDVRLDADGAPLLRGEGARIETTRPTRAWRESSEAVGADVAGWRALAEALLEASGAALPVEVERALDAREVRAAGDALLATWPGLPLELAPAAPPAAARERMRRRERAVGLEAVWARAALLLERIAERVPRLAAHGLGALRPRLGRARPEARSRPSRLGGVRPRLATVRPRFWAVGAAGAAALVLAVVLLPAGGAAGDEPEGRVLVSDPPSTPTSTAPSATEPAPRAPGPAPPAEPTASVAAPSADPLAGAAMLLAEREACLDAGDAACLVGLHEPDSPQLSAAEPWRMPDDGRLELVQRLGDAWLLRVVSEDEPASVLVMSSEAGWTLRDAWSG